MKYYAFLRAINIGKRRIKMDTLKQIFVEIGFENVNTFIASGNIIFESQNKDVSELSNLIESELQTKLGYEVKTFLRTSDEIESILENNPFEISDEKKQTIYISFLNKKPIKTLYDSLLDQQSDIYKFRVIDTVLYTLRTIEDEPSVFSNNYIEKLLKVSATTRNINTLEKILQI